MLDRLQTAIAEQDSETALHLCQQIRAATSDLFDSMDALAALEQQSVLLPFAFADVYHACGQVVHGQIPLAAWLERVTTLERSLTADLEATAPFDEIVQTDAESLAMLDEVRAHMTQALQGLARIRQYESDRDVTHLDDGWTLLAAAAMAMRDTLSHAQPGAPTLDWGQA